MVLSNRTEAKALSEFDGSTSSIPLKSDTSNCHRKQRRVKGVFFCISLSDNLLPDRLDSNKII